VEVGGAAVGLYDRRHLRGLGGLVQVGWGLNLVLAASVVLVVMSFVLMSKTKPRTVGPDDAVEDDGQGVVAMAGAPETDRLERLGELRDKGLITDDEFAAKRAEILAGI
jgi:hypothetical protein